METVVSNVMPTTPNTRAIIADRSEDQSEADWKSRRLVTSRTSTANATNDSSKSAPATRCKTMVSDSSATATRHARRCPRRIPRPRATSASPEMATMAPAATLARSGRNSSTTCSRPRSGRGEGVEQVDDPGDQDGGRGPATHPPGPAVGLVEVGSRRPRLAHRVGSHQRGVQAPGTAPPGHHPLEGAGRPEIVAAQQHPDVQLGSGLELDPAHPLVVDEDRGESQPSPVLLDHLGGGPHVGVEPHYRGG